MEIYTFFRMYTPTRRLKKGAKTIKLIITVDENELPSPLSWLEVLRHFVSSYNGTVIGPIEDDMQVEQGIKLSKYLLQ